VAKRMVWYRCLWWVRCLR